MSKMFKTGGTVVWAIIVVQHYQKVSVLKNVSLHWKKELHYATVRSLNNDSGSNYPVIPNSKPELILIYFKMHWQMVK